MAKRCKITRPPVSRRDFLTLATAGATLAVTGVSGERMPGTTLRPGEIARWEAGKPARSEGIALITNPGSQWTIEDQAGVSVASIQPSRDYYTRAEFLARVTKALDSPVWLTMEYLDHGFGLIAIDVGMQHPHPVLWRNQWGVARLNTGRLRRAVFHIDPPAFESTAGPETAETPNLRIRGLAYLRAISVETSRPEIEPVPQVKPVVQLDTPFQCDINIRADSPLGQEADGIAAVRNMAPLVRALGFNAVESYVQWNYVERQPGVFDWSHYDAIVNELRKNGLKLFPLLIVGSA